MNHLKSKNNILRRQFFFTKKYQFKKNILITINSNNFLEVQNKSSKVKIDDNQGGENKDLDSSEKEKIRKKINTTNDSKKENMCDYIEYVKKQQYKSETESELEKIKFKKKKIFAYLE